MGAQQAPRSPRCLQCDQGTIGQVTRGKRKRPGMTDGEWRCLGVEKQVSGPGGLVRKAGRRSQQGFARFGSGARAIHAPSIVTTSLLLLAIKANGAPNHSAYSKSDLKTCRFPSELTALIGTSLAASLYLPSSKAVQLQEPALTLSWRLGQADHRTVGLLACRRYFQMTNGNGWAGSLLPTLCRNHISDRARQVQQSKPRLPVGQPSSMSLPL